VLEKKARLKNGLGVGDLGVMGIIASVW